MNQPDIISSTEDTIDVRDIMARVEWLESDEAKDRDNYQDKELEEFAEELTTLTELLDNLKAMGGDEQWRGSWYPGTLIHDDHFEDYARELADDITPGLRHGDMSWPLNCIDWEEAAEQLQMDYSSVDFEGQEYWYR